MKLLLSALLLLLIVPARGDDSRVETRFGDFLLFKRPPGEERPPELDPKRIINASNSFLKEREPEMTAEEYALYEKVMSMLSSNPPFALKILTAMMDDKEPPSPAFEFILGNAYYAADEIQKSEASYRHAVLRYPTFLRAWNNLGVLYFHSERYPEAVECFSKSVVLGDHDPTTFGLLAYSLERQGNVVPAEVAYMQALAGAPGNSEWKEGLLRIYIDGKQFSRAESLVKSLIHEQPKETRFWMTYANILLAEKRHLEATALLEVAAATSMASVDELTLLGDLYAEQNLVPEALAIYQKVFAQTQNAGEKKLLYYAQVLITAGKLTEAAATLAALHGDLSPAARIELLQEKSDLFAAQKHWREARTEIESLLNLEPLNGRALLALGRIHEAEDDVGRATLAFEAAYRIPGSTYRASLELANIEMKNRHYAKSVEYLEKALSIEKNEAVEDYLARIKTLVVKEG